MKMQQTRSASQDFFREREREPRNTRLSEWRKRGVAFLRIGFGLVWAFAAWLKWRPEFISKFSDTVTGSRDGQPAAVQRWIDFWANIINTNPHLFAYILASTETALAVCFILGLLTNLACVLAIVLSLGIWSVAEGFGGPYKPGESTDIGTALPYAILAAILLVTAAGRYYSIDQWLTPRLGRFGFLASGVPWRRRKEQW